MDPIIFHLWGISATIGNLEQAQEVLVSPVLDKIKDPPVIVKANLEKRIEIESVIPDEIEKYPWAGHLGIKLIHKVIPIIEKSRTTLIFINTRGMSETLVPGNSECGTGTCGSSGTASRLDRYGPAFMGGRSLAQR